VTGVILLIVGFGFVIFVHELGHFLAAKAVGIKVEQFALGFGQAMICWRKGIGFAVGNTARQFDQRVRRHIESRRSANATLKDKAEITTEQINQAAKELGLGDTEYRLNWIPLGGYVKMLGQDDLDPTAKSLDPRSFNGKSIAARMLVVSAGVIMNIVFGTIGFMLVFTMGMNVPAAIVGGIAPQSPAQEAITVDGKPAPLRVGDRILKINGALQHDFTKIGLNTALARAGEPLTLLVKRSNDGAEQEVLVTPRSSSASSSGFLMLGIEMPRELRAPELTKPQAIKEYEELPAEMRLLHAGETIVAINGTPVQIDEINKLDDAVQASGGEPVQLTVQAPGGAKRQVSLKPEPAMPFGGGPYVIAGMHPRAVIDSLTDGSPARGRLEPGDVILAIHIGDDVRMNPSFEEFRTRVAAAVENNKTVDLTVLRKGKELDVKGLMPTVRLESGKGLGVRGGAESEQVVVAAIDANSPSASIPPGSTIRKIAGQSVPNWASVLHILQQQKPDTDIPVEAIGPSGDPGDVREYAIRLGQTDIQQLTRHRYTYSLVLHDMTTQRKTRDPATAALWGVSETRDFILQFYITLRRMTEGSVSPKNMMGPLGIFHAGTIFADKGADYLIWFLAMISANLAVVNFLPIPIVDGGLFTFLLIEKIKGSPVSDRMQMAAQYLGIGLLAFVFLFVTYQDIIRYFTVH
jgi:regulator of sigma E protease